MDGTLTVSNIDFAKMRESIDIPSGDLFTTMESWPDSTRIATAMNTILQLEAEAVATLELMPGLVDLLTYLRNVEDVKLAIVTRNTPTSVDGFMELLDWGSHARHDRPILWDKIITRHHRHVKPDYRLLLDLADEWNIPAERLLMVGDSTEDVECGNGAGTATCLIEGGGNELSVAHAPPPGAVPTFTVASLSDLQARIQAGRVAPGRGRPRAPQPWTPGGGADRYGASAGSSDFVIEEEEENDDVILPLLSVGETIDGDLLSSDLAGAPPPGVDFLQDMYTRHYLKTAESSFPRMGAAVPNGMATSTIPGDRVLHVGCGNGALTKLLASQGLECVGVDVATYASKTSTRGLLTAALPAKGALLADQSLGAAEKLGVNGGGKFDAVVIYDDRAVTRATSSSTGSSTRASTVATLVEEMASSDGLEEIFRVLKAGGRLCLEARVHKDTKFALMAALWRSGFTCVYAMRLRGPGLAPSQERVLRLTAIKPKEDKD